MTSATSTSWEKELRKNICTNFGRGIRVNGENSGRTKILYVYNEGLGSANKRTSQTLPIEWKKTSGIEIIRGNKNIYVVLISLNNFLIFDGNSNDEGLQRADRWG